MPEPQSHSCGNDCFFVHAVIGGISRAYYKFVVVARHSLPASSLRIDVACTASSGYPLCFSSARSTKHCGVLCSSVIPCPLHGQGVPGCCYGLLVRPGYPHIQALMPKATRPAGNSAPVSLRSFASDRNSPATNAAAVMKYGRPRSPSRRFANDPGNVRRFVTNNQFRLVIAFH